MKDSQFTNNNDDQWSHAVSYAKRCGGIIPDRSISFRVKPTSYTLKAHWGRWIFISILVAVMLFHFLPILLPILIPQNRVFLMCLFGVVWLYFIFRLSIPIGKITFEKEDSDIHIQYGTILELGPKEIFVLLLLTT